MKKLHYLLMILIIASFATCDIVITDGSSTDETTEENGGNGGNGGNDGNGGESGETGTMTGSYSDNGFDDQASMDFANAMIVEVNFARTNPSGYADQRLKSDYDAGRDNGSYTQFKNGTFPPVEPLVLNAKLNAAADKRAKYMADNGIFEHGDPKARMQAEGYNGSWGENIAADPGSEANANNDPVVAAKGFVKQWIIDDGYPPDNAGHRIILMKGSFEDLGVGFHHDSSSPWGNYSVQNFGKEY
jgi:hypothetical protein